MKKVKTRDLEELERRLLTDRILLGELVSSQDELARVVRELSRKRKGDSKLVKLGSLMVVTPIPVISEVPGFVLIAIGALLNLKDRGFSVRDINEVLFRSHLRLIRELDRLSP